jgi:hypothetical protein
MKVCHIATLVGWYLLQPSTHRAGNGVVFHDRLPLNLWRHVASSDTAKECQAQIEHMELYPSKIAEEMGTAFIRCISSDDPRLKRN